jgi:hypothetical protein
LCLVLAVESVSVYRFYADSDPLPGLKATAIRTESTTLPTSAAFAGPSRSSFVHRATPSNTDGNSTYLDHPLTDGDPDAVVLVTAAWEAGGVNNARPVGVWYDADRERWAIYNQDQAPMPEGAAFNVAVSGRRSGEVATPGSGRAGGAMQVPGYDLPRTPILGNSMNESVFQNRFTGTWHGNGEPQIALSVGRVARAASTTREAADRF